MILCPSNNSPGLTDTRVDPVAMPTYRARARRSRVRVRVAAGCFARSRRIDFKFESRLSPAPPVTWQKNHFGAKSVSHN